MDFPFDAKANDSERKADIYEIQNALEIYYVDNDHYPDQLSKLVPDYLSEVPVDPNNSSYTYTPKSNPSKSYNLSATLEDPNNSAYPDYTVTNKQ